MTAKKQFIISLFFLLAIAWLGLVMRAIPVYGLNLNFNNLLHAHSHVAFLGWLHGAFISFISYIFLKNKLNTKLYKFIYWFTFFNITGMYISFQIQGYKFFSILFLSLFLIATYFYLYYFFKNKSDQDKYPATYKFVKAGLFLQFLSSLSPWSLVFILKLFGKQSNFYKYDIFYYLHFQYNGWFLFALFGLTFYLLEQKRISINQKQIKQIYILMIIGVFFGYFSNTLWAKPGTIYNILSLIGGFAEILSLFILLRILLRYYRYLKKITHYLSYYILQLVLLLLFTKAVLQFMGSIQYFADLSNQIRDFIIGYLHLIMLGIFTPFLLVIGQEFDFYKLKKESFYLFYTGFILTELLIFARAVFVWFEVKNDGILFNNLLFVSTIILFLGILSLMPLKKYVNKENI